MSKAGAKKVVMVMKPRAWRFTFSEPALKSRLGAVQIATACLPLPAASSAGRSRSLVLIPVFAIRDNRAYPEYERRRPKQL